MTYTGDVTSGGPADVRVLPDAVIRKASVSAQDNNAYVVTCRRTGARLLVDAADSADRLLELIAAAADDVDDADAADDAARPRLHTVVTTHRHWDHHRALADVLAATGARSAAGADDADDVPVAPDLRLVHGDVLDVGQLRFEVVHLRGHTPGSVALVLRSRDGSAHAFTGDSLFPGGVGNTWKDAAKFAELVDDVEQRLYAVLDDAAWVYPGHGKDTTIGAERPHLQEWRDRGW